MQNPKSIQKVVVLLVPGLTPSLLDLPTTSPKGNPNLPLLIPAPDPKSKSQVPFVASTFMHACPTKAPGEATKMHSILSSFFMGPVSGEEKKKRILERINCPFWPLQLHASRYSSAFPIQLSGNIARATTLRRISSRQSR